MYAAFGAVKGALTEQPKQDHMTWLCVKFPRVQYMYMFTSVFKNIVLREWEKNGLATAGKEYKKKIQIAQMIYLVLFNKTRKGAVTRAYVLCMV